MEQLLIFPYNGNGLEALNSLGNNFEFIGFIDDTPEKQGKNKLGFEVFGRDIMQKYPKAKILAVPGSPTSYTVRKDIIAKLNVPENRFATVIDPKATVSPLAKIGYNVLIMPGVVITSNAVIGNHVCILPNSVIHHDSSVGDYTLIGSNVTVAGHTLIGQNCYIGSGTSIINGISVGNGTLIGMGSNVIKTLPENVKAVGNPSKIIK
jgi:sugar O-acyltransferase (sialic acid O-acetyltransferase NeuD family)